MVREWKCLRKSRSRKNVYYEILDFHGGDYEQYCLLGLDLQFGGCVPIMQGKSPASIFSIQGA